MDLVNSLIHMSTSLSQAQTQQATDLAVLKKAIDQQGANALALLEAIPPVQSLPDPSSSLGQNIDVFA